MTAPPEEPARWWRRTWVTVALIVGSPLITAAMTVAAITMTVYFRAVLPPLLWQALLAANAALAVVGTATAGLLSRGAVGTRVTLALALGVTGFIAHCVLAYCCGGCAGVVIAGTSD